MRSFSFSKTIYLENRFDYEKDNYRISIEKYHC